MSKQANQRHDGEDVAALAAFLVGILGDVASRLIRCRRRRRGGAGHQPGLCGRLLRYRLGRLRGSGGDGFLLERHLMCERHLTAQVTKQVRTHLRGALVSGVGILLHGPLHDRLEAGGDVRVDPARRNRVFGDVLVGHRDRALSCERSLAAKQLVQHDTE